MEDKSWDMKSAAMAKPNRLDILQHDCGIFVTFCFTTSRNVTSPFSVIILAIHTYTYIQHFTQPYRQIISYYFSLSILWLEFMSILRRRTTVQTMNEMLCQQLAHHRLHTGTGVWRRRGGDCFGWVCGRCIIIWPVTHDF